MALLYQAVPPSRTGKKLRSWADNAARHRFSGTGHVTSSAAGIQPEQLYFQCG
ncbi:MAG: hypothetical protein ACLR5S_11655 [Ruminococcus sp.]